MAVWLKQAFSEKPEQENGQKQHCQVQGKSCQDIGTENTDNHPKSNFFQRYTVNYSTGKNQCKATAKRS
jgi:hypothetical protein